jgi:hypothetical protein
MVAAVSTHHYLALHAELAALHEGLVNPPRKADSHIGIAECPGQPRDRLKIECDTVRFTRN